jgi:hypothetical protein
MMTSGASAESLVFRPPLRQRVLTVAAGIGGGVLMTVGAVVESPVFLLFAMCAVSVIVEGIRTDVVVDFTNGQVTSTRAFRRCVVAMADVVNVRVPPWGPLALTLRKGTSKTGGGIWPGQVLTGLYSGHQGSDPIVYRLAAALGVPVVSVWPQIRSDDKGNRVSVSPEAPTKRGRVVPTIAICLALIAVGFALMAVGCSSAQSPATQAAVPSSSAPVNTNRATPSTSVATTAAAKWACAAPATFIPIPPPSGSGYEEQSTATAREYAETEIARFADKATVVEREQSADRAVFNLIDGRGMLVGEVSVSRRDDGRWILSALKSCRELERPH